MPIRSSESTSQIVLSAHCGAKAPTLYDAYFPLAAAATGTGAVTLTSPLDDIVFKNPSCVDAVVSITFTESGQDCNACAVDAAPSTVTQYLHLPAGANKGFGAATAEITAFEVKFTNVPYTASASADFGTAVLALAAPQTIIVEGSKDGSCCTPSQK